MKTVLFPTTFTPDVKFCFCVFQCLWHFGYLNCYTLFYGLLFKTSWKFWPFHNCTIVCVTNLGHLYYYYSTTVQAKGLFLATAASSYLLHQSPVYICLFSFYKTWLPSFGFVFCWKEYIATKIVTGSH